MSGKPIDEAVRALVTELDEYLRGCPDPDKTRPAWMLRKASRLLWRSRAVIQTLTAAQHQEHEREHLRRVALDYAREIEDEDARAAQQQGQAAHWKVGRFRSSHTPERAVLVLSVGAAIERDEQHHSFIEWVYAHPAEAQAHGGGNCWSCGKLYTLKQRGDADGNCPSCGAEIELDAQQQGQAVAWNVVRIGNYGAAYDQPSDCRAFTYDHQPGNVDAGRLGMAAGSAANASSGDSIDRGLGLLKELQRAGFGVFQIGTAQPMQQGGGEVGP